MQAIVKNFRGIAEATIDIKRIALIAGHNGAGKTSIARAVAAAATGKPIPYAKITKAGCKVLLRTGTKSGMAAIGTNDGSTQIEWPKAEAHSTGTPPVASEIATGITDLFSMKGSDALAYMIDLLKAAPDFDDVLNALTDADMSKEELEVAHKTATAVWKAIQENGWQAAHAQAVVTGSRLKGAWQQIAGTNYGTKKADEWFPEGWEDVLLQHTPESLDKAIAAAQAALEEVVGKSAVSRAEQEKLQALADRLPSFEKLVADRHAAHDAAALPVKEIEEKLKNTANPNSRKDYACPHCEALVNVTAVSGSEFLLTKAEAVDENHIKEARNIYAGLCGDQQRLTGVLHDCQRQLTEANYQLKTAQQAQETLKGGEVSTDAPTEDTVLAARQLLSNSLNTKAMVEKYHAARKASAQIAASQVIIDALDETGIRKTKLAQCLDAFTVSYIEPLCGDFGIPSLLVDSDLSVSMGETAYPMLSASEQFRMHTVLQVAIAKLEKASVIIIDGADILDKPGRGRLLNMVMNTMIPTIICMTLNKPDMAPNLAQAGIGVTYWVENGTCQPVGGAVSERAAA